jgi:predicted RNase H-like HicB family nuclease
LPSRGPILFQDKTSLEYTVIYEWGTRNWSAYVPDLLGCVATGKMRQDVERMIREAVEFHIEGLRERGQPVPEPSVVAGVVSIPSH